MILEGGPVGEDGWVLLLAGSIMVTAFLALVAAQLLLGSPTSKGRSNVLVGPSSPRDSEQAQGAGECSGEAAICWASRHGRFKSCGLRPDPLDESVGPPVYSIKPLDLPLPAMGPGEAERLETLVQSVADLSESHRTDRSTLVRYLRARKGDARAAEKYFRKAAAWREAHGCYEALTTWNLALYEQCLAPWWLSGGFFGHGRKGEMIGYERIGRCKWPTLCRSLPFEELVKVDIIHCMRTLAACEEDALRRGAPMGDGILVADCHGFGFDDVRFDAILALNRLVENRNLIMPETITRILVIRAPNAWVHAWSMFKHIMDPGIAGKVEIAGSDTLELLRRYIDDSEIPAYLGGQKHIEGDPECRKVLAPGGPCPPEALARFRRLMATQEQPGKCARDDAKEDRSCLSQPAERLERHCCSIQ